MPLSRAEVLGQVRPQITGIQERIHDLKEIHGSMVGNVDPDHINQVTDEYKRFLQRPGITEGDKQQWMLDHTTGDIERNLIRLNLMRNAIDINLESVNEDMTILATISHPLAQEITTGVLSQLRDHYIERLGQIEQLRGQSYSIATGLTAQDQELRIFDAALEGLTLA